MRKIYDTIRILFQKIIVHYAEICVQYGKRCTIWNIYLFCDNKTVFSLQKALTLQKKF